MRVLMLLSNAFRPDARVYKEAKSLLNAGFEITIIAWDRERKYPEKEHIEGIEVIRTGPLARGKGHFISDVRKFWKSGERISKEIQFDIIHAHDFDTLPLGVRLKKKTGKPLIFDAHEIYSEMIRIDVPAFVTRVVQMKEDLYLRHVDRVIVVNDYQRRFYSKRVGEHKITVVMNAKDPVDPDKIKIDEIRKKLGVENAVSLIYLGALEEGRFVKELADFADTIDGIKVIIGGYGNCEDYVKKAAERKNNLIYLGFVHPDMVIPYTAAADFVVAMYREVQSDRIVTKFFDAVSAGKPMIVNDNGELTAKLVKKYGMGVVITYDMESFSRTVEYLKKNPEKIAEMGKNATHLRKTYSWKAMEKKLIKAYKAIISP